MHATTSMDKVIAMKRTYLITGIIILLLIAVGLLVWHKAVKAPGGDLNTPVVPPAPTHPVPPVTPTPVAPPISQPPEGWKTYENKEFGFAFDYPGDWTIMERSSKLNWASKEQNRNILIDSYYIDFHDLKNKANINNQGEFIFGLEITKYPTDEVKRRMLEYTPENTIILDGKIRGGLTESFIGPEADFFIDNTSFVFTTPDRSNLLKDILRTFRFLK